jgi:hypothetical protein
VGMMGLLFHNGHQMYNLDILSIPLDHLTTSVCTYRHGKALHIRLSL